MDEAFLSSLTSKQLVEFTAKFSIPNPVELIPAGDDRCILTVQGIAPFMSIPSLLAISFVFPFWWMNCADITGVCPTQLVPLDYKVIKILSKFAKLANVGITLQHLIYVLMPIFYQGTILIIHHRGKESLVVKKDENGSRQFWTDFFC